MRRARHGQAGRFRAFCLQNAGPAPLDAAQGAGSGRRVPATPSSSGGGADGGDHRACAAVWPAWLPPGHGLAAGRRVAGEPQARRAALAARGPQGACAPAEARAVVAEQRLLRAAAAGAGEPRVGLRLRRGPGRKPFGFRRARGTGARSGCSTRRNPAGVCGWGGRVHSRMPGDPGGTQAGFGRGHRRAGRSSRKPLRGFGAFIARGTPGYVWSDNGPEFVATAVKGWISGVGARTAFIEPGSPWENGTVESGPRQAAGRAAERRGVRHAARGARADRAMARALQQGTPALFPGLPATRTGGRRGRRAHTPARAARSDRVTSAVPDHAAPTFRPDHSMGACQPPVVDAGPRAAGGSSGPGGSRRGAGGRRGLQLSVGAAG